VIERIADMCILAPRTHSADRISDTPNVAAADHERQPYRHEENELTDVRTGGPGWPTTIPCGACGNVGGNLAVWYSWWCSRNGDATENDEFRCGTCRKYSLYVNPRRSRAAVPVWDRRRSA
jgi:hypothetical protein